MPSFFYRAQMGIAAGCVAALSAPSLAQEPASHRLWDGFYVGALTGGSWQQQNTSYADIQTVAPIFTIAMNLGTLSPTMKAGTPGFSGGAFLGYNMQSGPLVFGVERNIATRACSGKSLEQIRTFGMPSECSDTQLFLASRSAGRTQKNNSQSSTSITSL